MWCDDHTWVKQDTGSRCMEANFVLRRAMATVLGPQELCEDKFTTWSTRTKLLDTVSGTVPVSVEKIVKAQARIGSVLTPKACSESTRSKRLASLRYVSTCFPAARAFYRNVQVFSSSFSTPHERRFVASDARDDLEWFAGVLTFEHRFNAIPVEQFANIQPT
ncbi:hypothetical protein PHMEG_0005457 [Phytophthora megakarya]|uniref:Uncharacterized protein n=1 Tax=Phytophthora megakarya TaxID=4795 RepID=A0A225WR98_9STRA|nr:hypothetical protein PHMEG_0005457 [Phytophthora megakarya]